MVMGSKRKSKAEESCSDPRFHERSSKIAIDSRFTRMFNDNNFAPSRLRIDKRGKTKGVVDNNLRRYYYPMLNKRDDGHVTISGGEETDDEETRKLKLKSNESEEFNTKKNYELYDQEESILEIDKETNRLAIVNMDWSQVMAVDLFVLSSSFLPEGGEIKSVAVYPTEFGLQRMEEEAVRGPVGLFDDDKEKEDDDDDDDDVGEEMLHKKLRKYELSKLRYYYAVVECDSIVTADYLYKTCDGAEFESSSLKLDLRFIPDSLELKHPPRDVAREKNSYKTGFKSLFVADISFGVQGEIAFSCLISVSYQLWHLLALDHSHSPSNYDGLDFVTRAWPQSKVYSTSDDDEPQWKKALRRLFKLGDQLAGLEFPEIIASEDSGTEDDESDNDIADKSTKTLNKKNIRRALLQLGEGSGGSEDEEGQDMEVTFNTGLEYLSKHILEKKDKQSETVWETCFRKRKEKKKAKKTNANSSDDEISDSDHEVSEQPDNFFIDGPSIKVKGAGKHISTEKKNSETAGAEASRAELELLLANDNGADSSLKGYNLKPKKAKGKKRKEIFDGSKIPSVDYEDPRFSQMFKSPLFALDPTDPQFRRSAAYARQLVQKQRTGDTPDATDDKQVKIPSETLSSGKSVSKDEHLESYPQPPKTQNPELSLMVKSIKMKAKQHRASHDEVSRSLPAPKRRKK